MLNYSICKLSCLTEAYIHHRGAVPKFHSAYDPDLEISSEYGFVTNANETYGIWISISLFY